jgi:tetratricopeptide (TPR) repeat protein
MATVNTLLLIHIVLVLSLAAQIAGAQNTVFKLLRNENVLAEEHYADEEYQLALELYLRIAKNKPDTSLDVKIARCYYFLRQYNDAGRWYQRHFQSGELRMPDLFYYAETLCILKNYREAMKAYRACLKKEPDNEFVMMKLWRLDNIRFLYEDSAHYAVRPAAVNTHYAEIGAAPYRNGLLFLSNRKMVQVVEQIDAYTNASFYRLYYAPGYVDSVSSFGSTQHVQAGLWQSNIAAKYHQGPVAFFDGEKQMVFTRTGSSPGRNGRRTLQLFFARHRDGEWEETEAFPFNSADYSITGPSISNDGSILYFSSDMKGGKGGKDLYRSENVSGKWTKPVNLSDLNTPYDEAFPYLAKDQTLYFASNGHPGLGGLDIFKVDPAAHGVGEVQNVGYPLNTNYDEFAITIDSLNTHGYISSNRNGANNDDIYEFDIDLQSYPLSIEGVLKYKELNWSDSSQLVILSNAKLSLIDNIRNISVYECASDSTGHFRIEIPYFSTYKIKVTGEDNHENIVSLEIPKHRKTDTTHEIVVVKDPFKTRPNQVPK